MSSSIKIFPLKVGTDEEEGNASTEKEKRNSDYQVKVVEILALYINPLIYVIFIVAYFARFMSFFLMKYSY